MTRVASPADLAARLTKGPAPSVVLALGPERLLRDGAAEAVSAAVLGDPASPDVVAIHGAGGSAEAESEAVERFFGEARTGSLFGGGKVVVLRSAEALLSRFKKEFTAWLASPAAGITAVVLAEEATPALVKSFDKAGLVVNCSGGRRDGEPPERFAGRRAREKGKRLGPAEARLLVELIGPDLGGLDMAVEQLCLFAGDEPAIGRRHVEDLFQASHEGSVWAFGDLLVEGDAAGAIREAGRCFAEGIPDGPGSRRITLNESTITVRLLSSFTNSAMRALALRRQLDAGVSRDALDWGVRAPPPFAQRRALAAVSRRKTGAFESLVLFAEETERSLKSGGVAGRESVMRLAGAVGLVK